MKKQEIRKKIRPLREWRAKMEYLSKVAQRDSLLSEETRKSLYELLGELCEKENIFDSASKYFQKADNNEKSQECKVEHLMSRIAGRYNFHVIQDDIAELIQLDEDCARSAFQKYLQIKAGQDHNLLLWADDGSNFAGPLQYAARFGLSDEARQLANKYKADVLQRLGELRIAGREAYANNHSDRLRSAGFDDVATELQQEYDSRRNQSLFSRIFGGKRK